MNKNMILDQAMGQEMPQEIPYSTPRAIVAYTDKTSFRCLKWLRRGFRHCMTLVSVPPYWVLVDGLSNRTHISVLSVEGLAVYLADLHRAGYRCQYIPYLPSPPPRLGMMPHTCVETAKRLLGISNRFVLTPFQLFKHINKNILTTNNGLVRSDG